MALFGCQPMFAQDFDALVKTLPQKVQADYAKDPETLKKLISSIVKGDEYFWLLVDKTRPLPANYAPKDLVNLDTLKELSKSKVGLKLRSPAALALVEMAKAAKKEKLNLIASSCYRSYQDQVLVFEREVKNYGLEQAKRESAEAGKSQHQTGLAVDFAPISTDFDKKPEAAWLLRNSLTYGFSISYPEGYEELTGYMHESWHYRYVGLPCAQFIGWYFDGIQQNALVWLDKNKAALKKIFL